MHLIVCVGLWLSVGAQQAENVTPSRLAKVHLVIDPPTLKLVSGEERAGGRVAQWSGVVGDSRVMMDLRFTGSNDLHLGDPAEVLSKARTEAYGEAEHGCLTFEQRGLELRAGPYGSAPFVAVARGTNTRPPDKRILLLAGMLENGGYVLKTTIAPPIAKKAEDDFLDSILSSLRFDGPVSNGRWSDDEARTRWARDVPSTASTELRPLLRTDHYIVMSDGECAQSLGELLEMNFARIRDVLSFPETSGRRLLPIFLFRTKQGYVDYLAKVEGVTTERAEASGGRSLRDWFATWCRDDPSMLQYQLLHEATHGVLFNFLGIHGGGVWFHEGIAEYISRPRSGRDIAAYRVRCREHVPLTELIRMSTFLSDTSVGPRSAGELYAEAGLFIEYLREERLVAKHFLEFVQVVGDVPSLDIDKLKAALEIVYGRDLASLETQWIDYCKRRGTGR